MGKSRAERIQTLMTIALTFPPGDIRRTELLAIAEELEVEGGETDAGEDRRWARLKPHLELLDADPTVLDDLARRIEDAEAHAEWRVLRPPRPTDVTSDLVDEHGIWDRAVWDDELE